MPVRYLRKLVWASHRNEVLNPEDPASISLLPGRDVSDEEVIGISHQSPPPSVEPGPISLLYTRSSVRQRRRVG